jgi:predicted DNA-binding protein (MmcQ/YjbR family)
MISLETFRLLSLSFPETTEEPHFHKISFRVKGKIFATVEEKTEIACIMLSPKDQSVYCLIDPAIIYPVPNKWGLKGSTYVVLKKVKKEILFEMLGAAYCKVAPSVLAEKFKK